MTNLGGANGVGVLYEYDPVTNVYTTRFTFISSGTNPWRSLGSLVAFRGKLYGQTMNGGLNGSGAVFSFDPALSGPSALSVVFHHKNDVTGFYNVSSATLYTASPQLVVFPDCQLSATATVASTTMCVNDAVGLAVAVTGQNCQPTYSWSGDAMSRLTNPANTSAVSATVLQAGLHSFSVTITESLCSVSAATSTTAFDIFSVQNGNWNDPATWSCGRVPFAADIVDIRHAVTIPSGYSANTWRIRYLPGGKITVGLGARALLGN